MKHTKYLIIGGGPAGATAATAIRRLDEKGSILVLEKGPYPPYMRLDLSKGYMVGKQEKDGLFFPSFDDIAVKTNSSVVNLDSKNRIAETNNGESVEFEKALIATGSRVRTLNVPGSDLKNIFYLRSLEDAEAIRSAAKPVRDQSSSGRKKAVLVGGGLIGLELSFAFRKLGLDVDLLIREKFMWEGKVEEDLGRFIQKTLEGGGVNVATGVEATRFEEGHAASSSRPRRGSPSAATPESPNSGNSFVNSRSSSFRGPQYRVFRVMLSNGQEIETDMAVIGIGVVPNLNFMEGSGVETDKGVVTNEYLQTNIEGIFAAGDITQFYDPVLETRHMVGHWNNALWQGRLAGENIAAQTKGERLKAYGRVTSYDTRVFDLKLSVLGDPALGEKRKVLGDISKGSAAALYIKDKKVKGAVLLNWKDVRGITQKIANKEKVE